MSRVKRIHKSSTTFRSTMSLIIWPLVALILIRVTTNLNTNSHTGPHLTPSSCRLVDESNEAPSSYADILKQTIVTHQQDHEASACAAATKATHPRNNERYARYSSHKTTSTKHILSTTQTSSLTYLLSKIQPFAHTILSQIEKIKNIKTFFGTGILLADAAQVPQPIVNHDKVIIALNSTNFNSELIQYNHPFPHIKLVEYYLAFCGICKKFKHTYVQLAKEIQPWRNVLRPSAIDLGVSSNSPIAHSWSIDTIPTLRIHPPLSAPSAAKLSKQLAAWNRESSTQSDLQKSMYEGYSEAKPMIGYLRVVKYTDDAEKDADKVALMKADLLDYIQRYVAKYPNELPETWPNLKPVTEKTLADLRRHHPRQELFLIIDAGRNNDAATAQNSGSDQSSVSQPSLGLEIIMDLSSSAAWKAIRYVRASENRALVEDVIAHKKLESSEQLIDDQNNNNNQNTTPQSESVKLLLNLLESKQTSSEDVNNVVLIHVDDSHSPFGQTTKTPTTKFPSITVVTESDLVTTHNTIDSLSNSNNDRTKRANQNVDEDASKMNLKRKLELVAHFINQTYIEVKEDREFLKALTSLDENPTSQAIKREAIEKFQVTRQENQVALDKNIKKSEQTIKTNTENSNSTITQLLSRLNPTSSHSFLSSVVSCQDGKEDDYEDKLKAIRYIFFQEVPRKSLVEKSPAEKLEKLNILVNLAAVIKVYFPLPDLASVQFMDAIHTHLIEQQTALSSSVSNQQSSDKASNSFDFRALKQVIKSLETEGKRLPEIKDWKHCKAGGYSCALWRLFHTLTAFEYKKLSQINQQYAISLASVKQASKKVAQPAAETVAASKAGDSQQAPSAQPTQEIKPSPVALERNNVLAAPVERVVSPPSTTTSYSLTILSSNSTLNDEQQNINNRKQLAEAELPEPVLLVMRDYITNFFSCEECAKNFRQEANDLSFDKIRKQEQAEFSLLWLWETHNRVSKRLSVSSYTNPPEHPKKWFPCYDQCPKCYNKPPSYLKDTNVELVAIFHESIDWNKEETLNYLVKEYTRQPMDMETNVFGYQLSYGFSYVVLICVASLLLIILLRCASCYIERQRRHKANLLNGNAPHYSVELQAH